MHVCVCFTVTMAKRVAVILSGCGVYDGTEIHEASAVLVHLSRAGAKVSAREEESIYYSVFVCFKFQDPVSFITFITITHFVLIATLKGAHKP